MRDRRNDSRHDFIAAQPDAINQKRNMRFPLHLKRKYSQGKISMATHREHIHAALFLIMYVIDNFNAKISMKASV